jgi:hypothetical protein
MQLRSIIFVTALAVAVAFPSAASADKCTKDQRKAMRKLENDPALDKACPFYYGSGSDSGSFDFEKIDPKAWAKASPCKDPSCVTYLKGQAAKVPNCEIREMNMKTAYQDELALCIDLASGNLTAAEIEKRISNFTDGGFGSGAGSGDKSPKNATLRKSGSAAMAITGGAVFVATALASLTVV